MLTEGVKAPEFTLPDDTGEDVSLSDFRGKKVVLYFYPKDNTSGCTTEACGFRDDHAAILAKGAVVLGVSPDGQKSHEGFKLKLGLPFHLLSDVDHSVADAYGVWGLKKNFGKEYLGLIRSTFIIDEEGTIIKAFSKVKTKTHSQDVLAVL